MLIEGSAWLKMSIHDVYVLYLLDDRICDKFVVVLCSFLWYLSSLDLHIIIEVMIHQSKFTKNFFLTIAIITALPCFLNIDLSFVNYFKRSSTVQ